MFRILVVIIFLICSGFSAEVSTVHNKKSSDFEYVITSANMGKVRYTKPSHSLKSVVISDKTYAKPILERSSYISNPGEPSLPSNNTFIAVDPTKIYSINVNVISSNIIENVDIAPQGSWDDDSENTSYSGELNYSNSYYPQNIASISNLMMLRELSVVSLTVSPFRYYPESKTLEEFTEIDIELIELGDNDNPVFVPQKRSRAFEPLYKSMVVNYSSLNRENIPFQRPSILYVLPSNIGNLLGTVNVLMDWKRRVGYEVNYISSSNVVNSSTNLKNYIQTAYEAWENPPEYVTIVADAEGSYDVPTFFDNWSGYNGEGDHPYSTLSGNDLLPELFVGRLSFDNQTDLQTIINKTLSYESSPYMGENWFERACLVGDPSTSGISCVITNQHINELFEIIGFDDIRTIYNGSFPSQMQNNITDGLGFFNYRGYYGVSGFTDSDVYNTNNGFMLPIATVITCGTGSFGSGESLSEAFLRAGTASNPRGSVVCIGTATLGTHTMFNNMVDMGFYYGALIDNISSAGGALMAGKLWLSRTYPSNPNQYVDTFTHWNSLMGDASLQMWTSYPEMLNVSHSYSLMKGTNFIDFNLTDSGGNPIEDAWVTIYKEGVLLESKYSNSNGFARLNVETDQLGEVLVTVTKKNHYPYQSSFQIYQNGPSVNVISDNIIINDSGSGNSIGNGNGVVNPGETIELSIPVSNYGTDVASGITGVLISENSNISIINNNFSYGDLSAGDAVNNISSPFVFMVDNDVHDGSEIHLLLNFNNGSDYSSTGFIELFVSGKDLNGHAVDVPGNSQDVLTPGQAFTVHIELSNSGSVLAENIIGEITSASSAIEIIDNYGSWSAVYPNAISSSGSSGNSFVISAAEDVIPGTVAHLILNVETSDGYSNSSIIPIQVGIPTVTDPFGPDSYGYYIYDSGDIEYLLAPVYDWVEIDSRYGGEGTYLSSLDDNGDNDDDVETISLPFNFRFYGVDYDQISICSNGWIAFGETDMSSFRNYNVPGPGGPGKMVAGFWDDLKLTNSGRVYTWYDSSNKVYIVQWSRVRTFQNNSTETFQIILRDPDYYMTPTGDGEILIQYMDFNNTSNGSYSWNQIHGDYCTVGIEDHTMTRGLQYTFNNSYPDAAMPLSDDTAILITTRGSDMRLDGDLNMDSMVDINDLLLLIDFIVTDQNQFNPFLADINSDGMVNILDMVRLIQMVMGYDL